MASYMLFVEGESQPNGLTAKLGVELLESDLNLIWAHCQTGPGGKAGLIGYWNCVDVLGIQTYSPDSQNWLPAPGPAERRFWIGTHKASPLEPKDILREKHYELSLPVTLEDGNDWLIPVAVYLPHVWGLDDNGEQIRRPKKPFEAFCRGAEAIYEQFNNPEAEVLSLRGQWDFVCQALALNYRLAPPVISALELIGDKSGGWVCAATIERQPIEKVIAEKKNLE